MFEPEPGPANPRPGFGVPVDSPRRPVVGPADRWQPAGQPSPGGRWNRGGRAWLLLAAGALVLLVAGFLLGAGVAGERPAPAPATAASPVPAPTPSASASAGPGQVPAPCVAAIRGADQAISYLVGNIRDRRLSRSMLAFVASKNSCLELTTR